MSEINAGQSAVPVQIEESTGDGFEDQPGYDVANNGPYARVQDGIVMELYDNLTGQPISKIFAPQLQWVRVPEGQDVQPYWTYTGTEFHPPVEPEPEQPVS